MQPEARDGVSAAARRGLDRRGAAPASRSSGCTRTGSTRRRSPAGHGFPARLPAASTPRRRRACARPASIAAIAAARSRATTRRCGSRSRLKSTTSACHAPRAPAASAETLAVDGHEVVITNPSKVLFPQAGYTKLDVARYFLRRRDRRAARLGRPAQHARPLSGRHRRRILLPEARADGRGRRGSRCVTIRFPSGRTRGRDRSAARRRSCVAGQPRVPRAASASRSRDATSTIRTSCASISIRSPTCRGRRCATSPRVVRRRSRDHGLRGWPKTSGKRGLHVLVRIETTGRTIEVRRAALALAREVERRVPRLATTQVVEGGAARRLHRLQPERQGPHGGRAPIRCVRRAMRAFPLRSHWDEVADADPADFTLATHARAVRARSVIRMRPSTTHAYSLDESARVVGAAGARRRGRRAMAAAICEGRRRAAARASVPARCRESRDGDESIKDAQAAFVAQGDVTSCRLAPAHEQEQDDRDRNCDPDPRESHPGVRGRRSRCCRLAARPELAPTSPRPVPVQPLRPLARPPSPRARRAPPALPSR